MEQQEYKLNGYSFRDYAEIGIGVHNLYRYAKKTESEEDMLNLVFKFKYGSTADKYHQFQEYYYRRIRRICKLNKTQRNDLLIDIKMDYYRSAKLFNLNISRIDSIWNDITFELL